MFKTAKIVRVDNCSNPEVNAFVKKNHYSKSVSRGNKHVFLLYVGGKLRGVATFGTPVGNRCQATYSTGLGDVMECKRFCLAPKAPKNTASWFMSKCLKELKKFKNIEVILSYADPEAGHEGIIYKASNFVYVGQQAKATQAIKLKGKGKPVHTRIVYQKINGVYTKTAQNIQAAMKAGLAKTVYLKPKHIYTYNLKK